jgi:hypothetical protein
MRVRLALGRTQGLAPAGAHANVIGWFHDVGCAYKKNLRVNAVQPVGWIVNARRRAHR